MCHTATRGSNIRDRLSRNSILSKALGSGGNWHPPCNVYYMKIAAGAAIKAGVFVPRGDVIMVEVAMDIELEQEPVGIIISRGSRDEATSRVSAYVWGPAPEDSETPRTSGAHRAA